MPKSSKKVSASNATAFLRSSNIRMDIANPDRYAHFEPTTKAARLLRAIIGVENERCHLVIAPYGTGKSIAATYSTALLENASKSADVLKAISSKIKKFDAQLFEESSRFLAGKTKKDRPVGISVILQGYHESVAEALTSAVQDACERTGREAPPWSTQRAKQATSLDAVLRQIAKWMETEEFTHVAIVWDEFGRHLESLVEQGKASNLNDLQTLAEFVSREQRLAKVTFSLLLHKAMFQYATHLGQAATAAWRKIEGRFGTIQYVDDSKERLRLVTQLLSGNIGAKSRAGAELQQQAQLVQNLRLFQSCTVDEIKELITTAKPLTPFALYSLPRISARIGQNERTLFAFVHYVCQETPAVCGLGEVYDFFASGMRDDVSFGGAHRHWLETESALAKADNDDQVRSIKVLSVLSFGTSGERSKVTRELLVSALRSEVSSEDAIEQSIETLIQRKVFYFRRHFNEICLGHGTDQDLRGRLESQKAELAHSFDLVQFLKTQVPTAVLRPVSYNAEFNVRRFFRTQYITPLEAESLVLDANKREALLSNCDGRILFFVPQDSDELSVAKNYAKNLSRELRFVCVLHEEFLNVREAALEVFSLDRMLNDVALTNSDPMVVPELQQMHSDALQYLCRLMSRLIDPSVNGAVWYSSGKSQKMASLLLLREHLSVLMRSVYPATPKINNESLVKEKPTAVMVNARKKLVMGILERPKDPLLGLSGASADVSLFNTILRATGLIRTDQDGIVSYSRPAEISDAGLREVWQIFEDFLVVESKNPRSFLELFQKLKAPPIGLRAGVLPLLLASAFRAFVSFRSILRNGEYLADILPSDVEDICNCPESYQIIVAGMDQQKLGYVEEFQKAFAPEKVSEPLSADSIRRCFDTLQNWKSQLPPAAHASTLVSTNAKKFRDIVANSHDPLRLFFEELPKLTSGHLNERLSLSSIKTELEQATVAYYDSARNAVSVELSFSPETDFLTNVGAWVKQFPQEFVSSLEDRNAQALLTRFAMQYQTSEALVDSISTLLVGRSVKRWDDHTIADFNAAFSGTVARINAIFLRWTPAVELTVNGTDLEELLQNRLADIYGKLIELVGRERAVGAVESMIRH